MPSIFAHVTGKCFHLFPAVLGMTAVAMATLSTTLLAHDFWIVPDAFQVAAGAPFAIRGQSGSKFPSSASATAPDRVAEARVIGGASDEAIRDLTVSGTSLLLQHRPTGAGQRVIAVALTERRSRVAPAQLKRYIAIEGAPELAERYERDGRYPTDSITQVTAKFAKTTVEIGKGGPRAFATRAGHPLELLALNDPAAVAVGDTLRVQLLYRGKAVGGVHLRAGTAPAAAGASSQTSDAVIETGTDGVARLVVRAGGLWNIRTLYAAPRADDSTTWELYFATLVFQVGR